MKKKVLILMSTYNGGITIARQIKSILDQTCVDVHIKIRDDGSNADTVKILKDLQEEYQGYLDCIFGENIGWKRSFMELLYSAETEYEYFGFSDQDDLWMEDKICTCIEMMENDSINGPKLAHCNSLSVDAELKPRKEQEYRVPCPPSHKAAIATEYFQGCGMLWNRKTMLLLQKYRPQNKELAHDYWVGVVSTFWGKIYFCEQPKFYHIRYEINSSADGNVKKGRLKRIGMLLAGKMAYMNPIPDLLAGYKEKMDPDDLSFLNLFRTYKSDFHNKMKILMDKEFRRPTVPSTILLKLSIFFNRY